MSKNATYTITNIEGKTGSSIYRITLDDETCINFNKGVLNELNLKIGSNIDVDKLKLDAGLLAEKHAFERGLHYLEFGARTKKQMTNYLDQKGYPPDAIEKTINKLAEYGYIDDNTYAKTYVKNRFENKGESKNRISRGLYFRGIDPDTAREVLSDITGEEEFINACNFLRQYLKKQPAIDKIQFIKKACSALKYRGFPGNIAVKALKLIVDERYGEKGDSGS
jgi:regulatory protein